MTASRVVLSIGSNIGDARGHLRSVRDAVAPHVIAASPIYRSAPWGGVEQQDFLNAVLIVDDPSVTAAAEWLSRAQRLENAAHRTREQRWGPRTLDVDIIAFGDVVSDDPSLTLPHPRAAERAFVLLPWLAADPDAILGDVAVSELVNRLAASERDSVSVWSADWSAS